MPSFKYSHAVIPFFRKGGGCCMDGGIYTRERCSQCGKLLKYVGTKGCICPDHPGERARTFIVKFPGKIYKTFTNLDEAEQLLNYLRYEKGDRGERFNPLDYKDERPNSFSSLATSYLERKKGKRSFRKIRAIMDRACGVFGDMNLKDITSAQIDDYLFYLKRQDGGVMSDKTRSNHCSQLHDFWNWCCHTRRAVTLAEFPVFPKIDFELGYRKITTWEIQEKVIAKVKDLTYSTNPKIWLAIDMLATYTALRPDDLLRVNEEDLTDTGWLIIRNPTKIKNKTKKIRLHPDHINEWRKIAEIYPGLPETPFFRHTVTIRRSKQGMVFGKNYLSKVWTKAAKEVGLIGVSLYPGTKHTTATATAELLGEEKAEKASGLTNKAFKRYCQTENKDAFDVVSEIRKVKKGKVLPLKKSSREG